jgi:transposase-like protein
MEVSMSSKRYMDKHKSDVANEVVDRGHSVVDESERLGINKHSLYE